MGDKHDRKDEMSDVTKLNNLAERIPAATRDRLEPWELNARCAFASSLYAEASLQESEAAESTRLRASMVLASIPIADYLTRVAYFDTELQKAARVQDDAEAGRVYAALCRLNWSNEYPSADELSLLKPELAAEMTFGHRAASRAAGFPKARNRRRH